MKCKQEATFLTLMIKKELIYFPPFILSLFYFPDSTHLSHVLVGDHSHKSPFTKCPLFTVNKRRRLKILSRSMQGNLGVSISQVGTYI